jgi:class 3 adenylate cyclase
MQILISQTTYALIGDEFVCSDLGEHEVKGFGTQMLHSLDAEWKHRR